MPQTLFLKPFISAPSNNWWCNQKQHVNSVDGNIKVHGRMYVVCMGMLTPRKFMQKRRKVETFKDAADETHQKNWRRLMKEIEESGSAVSVLRSERTRDQPLPRDLILGTLVRFKQLKKWNLVGEILEWLRTQHWWAFNEMDYLMLITAYGKQGDFNKAERVLSYMNKKGYPPSVISHTALMEAYGRGGQHNKAEAIFRRMQSSGPEPSAFTYQIILKTFVEVAELTSDFKKDVKLAELEQWKAGIYGILNSCTLHNYVTMLSMSYCDWENVLEKALAC